MTQPNFDRFSPLPTPSAREERVNDENGELRERIEELEGKLMEAEELLKDVLPSVDPDDDPLLHANIQQFLKPEGEKA